MFTKLVRIGRDAEMRYLESGTAVLEVTAVYDVGFGDKKQPVWVSLAMFGARAEKLVSHFTKGKQLVVSMDDVKPEAWVRDGEAKCKLSAKIAEFSFVSDGQSHSQQAPAPQQYALQPAQHAPQPQYQPSPQQYAPAPQQRPPQQNHQPQQRPPQQNHQPQGYGGNQQPGK